MNALFGLFFIFRHLEETWVRRIAFRLMCFGVFTTIASIGTVFAIEALGPKQSTLAAVLGLLVFVPWLYLLDSFGRRVFIARIPSFRNDGTFRKVYGFNCKDKGFEAYLLRDAEDYYSLMAESVRKKQLDNIPAVRQIDYSTVYPEPIAGLYGISVRAVGKHYDMLLERGYNDYNAFMDTSDGFISSFTRLIRKDSPVKMFKV